MSLHKPMAGVLALAGLATLAAWSFSRPPDERTPRKEAADEGPKARDYVLVPARQWWDDIVFT